MASREELLAANHSIPEIQTMIDADTLGYLSVKGLMKVVDGPERGFCDACFTGNYPVPVQLELSKLVLSNRSRNVGKAGDGLSMRSGASGGDWEVREIAP